jgi:hypothetical protein
MAAPTGPSFLDDPTAFGDGPTAIAPGDGWRWHTLIVDANGLGDGTIEQTNAQAAAELRDALDSWHAQQITVLYVLPNGRDRWTLVGVKR